MQLKRGPRQAKRHAHRTRPCAAAAEVKAFGARIATEPRSVWKRLDTCLGDGVGDGLALLASDDGSACGAAIAIASLVLSILSRPEPLPKATALPCS